LVRWQHSSDIAIFIEWCRSRGLNSLPASAEVVGPFLADHAALVSAILNDAASVKRLIRALEANIPPVARSE
jgi:hypothetical protein